MKYAALAFLSVAALIPACTSLSAGTISFDRYNGPGLGGNPAPAPPNIPPGGAANNDDPPGKSAKTVNNILKTFFNTDPIDMIFNVTNSGGTTEYFFDENVLNKSGVAWTDFHFELGFGTFPAAGGPDQFVTSGIGDFLDFDCPLPANPAPAASAFANPPVHRCNTLDWSGGAGIPNNGAGTFSFSVDVPDAAQIPSAAHRKDGQGKVIGYSFTLRQYPTTAVRPAPPLDFKLGEAVPEPSTWTLVAIGLALAASRRAKKRLGEPVLTRRQL